jgi:hypothetical protein
MTPITPPLPKPASPKSGTRQPENLYAEAQLLAYRAELLELSGRGLNFFEVPFQFFILNLELFKPNTSSIVLETYTFET